MASRAAESEILSDLHCAKTLCFFFKNHAFLKTKLKGLTEFFTSYLMNNHRTLYLIYSVYISDKQ
jgi:hypothetical protein